MPHAARRPEGYGRGTSRSTPASQGMSATAHDASPGVLRRRLRRILAAGSGYRHHIPAQQFRGRSCLPLLARSSRRAPARGDPDVIIRSGGGLLCRTMTSRDMDDVMSDIGTPVTSAAYLQATVSSSGISVAPLGFSLMRTSRISSGARPATADSRYQHFGHPRYGLRSALLHSPPSGVRPGG